MPFSFSKKKKESHSLSLVTSSTKHAASLALYTTQLNFPVQQPLASPITLAPFKLDFNAVKLLI